MIVMVLLLISQVAIATEDHGKVVKQYMDGYKDVAIAEMYRTGIPASIKLAQGMLESNWGRSELATVANNHFGIKCGSSWTGAGFYKEDDDRDSQGQLVKSCFRTFTDATESYLAHSDFLTDSNKAYRYGFLFDYDSTDYVSWAHGLRSAGYATDPKYPQKLISIIEKYNLSQYDVNMAGQGGMKQVASHTNSSENGGVVISSVTLPHERTVAKEERQRPSTKRKQVFTKRETAGLATSRLAYSIAANNSVRMVTAVGGETMQQLAQKVGLDCDELLAINEIYLQKEDVLEPGAKVYLEKKKRKLSEGPDFHVVQEGETMASIAQEYGLRLKSLYAKNRMPKGSTTVAGQRLFLKETASLSERPKFRLPNSNRNHAFLFEDDPTVN